MHWRLAWVAVTLPVGPRESQAVLDAIEKPPYHLGKKAQTQWRFPTEEMAQRAGLRIRQRRSIDGGSLKTTKVQAFGGSNPSPSASAFSKEPLAIG